MGFATVNYLWLEVRIQLVEVKIITGVHVISNTPTRARVGVHL